MLTSYCKLDVLLVIAVCSVICLRVLHNIFSRSLPLPPGPKPWPLVGNAPQMPHRQIWHTFADWGKLYGDVVYIRIFRREVVILNSYKAVYDLMVQRSARYSDRPRRVMGELCGYSGTLLFIEYGERWRKIRKLVQDYITGQCAAQYHPIQEAEANVFLKGLLESPELFIEHIRRFAGGLILQMTYGYTVASDDDAMVRLAEEVLRNISEVLTHGAFAVEAFPILKHLPRFTPLLGGFLRTARKWRENWDSFTSLPHEFVKNNMEHGTGSECFTSKALGTKEHSVSLEEEQLIVSAAASMYGGGADTAVSVTTSFFLAMALHPEIQKKAQDEIDCIIGDRRLPCFSDRNMLPYVECIVQECLRWNPVVPLVTHSTREDDTYRNFMIPAGAAIVANVWAITHDETVYPEPLRFLPDRFLVKDSGGLLNPPPRNFVFGFGRRICPGRDSAEASLWILVATTLAAFNISTMKDANGAEIFPEVEYTSGSISHPENFPCAISPRSGSSLKVLQELP